MSELRPPPRRRARRAARAAALVLGSLALLAALAWAARVPLLVAIGRHLSVADAARPADLIFLFNGDIGSRPFAAADLYRRGLAPRIVIARAEDDAASRLGVAPDPTRAAVAVLARLGVPDSALTVLERPIVTSTWDEAGALRAYLLAHPARRVLVVTSRFHTRRARWALRRRTAGLPAELLMIPADSRAYPRDRWWHSEQGLIDYTNEYIKLVYYRWHYR